MTGTRTFEIGLFTFGELTADPVTSKPNDPAVRLRELIDLAKIANQAGLDVFGVGEHPPPVQDENSGRDQERGPAGMFNTRGYAEECLERPLSDADVVDVIVRTAAKPGIPARSLDVAIWEYRSGNLEPDSRKE